MGSFTNIVARATGETTAIVGTNVEMAAGLFACISANNTCVPMAGSIILPVVGIEDMAVRFADIGR